ncbi:MAG: hypothetical protein NTV14_08510 [Coprothermobacterota bacterium]|nr:hypothetical protein [Coprothermobacterota bacterium]
MEKKVVLTKVLAVIGTVLVWFPIVATIALSVVGSIRGHTFLFDYLMPLELFPVALVGGGLLLWAALLARSRRGLIAWGFGIMAGMLIGGQVLAETTGLASGQTEPTGWIWTLVLVSIGIYWLVLVELGIAGLLLIRDLFRNGTKRTLPQPDCV